YKTLVSTFATAGVEGFLDGVFVVLCLTALYLLIHRSPNRRSKRPSFWQSLAHPMVFGSVLLLFIIVAHWACTMIRVLTAVSLISRGESAMEYLEDVSNPTIVTGAFLIVTAVAIADFLLIWRLWIVSEHNFWIILPPFLTGVGFIVCGYRGCAWFAESHAAEAGIHSVAVVNWIQAALRLTCTPRTNMYCSGGRPFAFQRYRRLIEEPLLAGLMVCIYKIHALTIFGDKSALKSVIIIVTESALLWSLWSIFVFINYHRQSFLSLLTFDGCPAMCGIAFMLINVRVGLGWDTSPYSL
ncbi:hypothetical protein BKA70DRAFT_1026585, partial [Coprinopsis sp. MPI-PUGE-AT-0042]